MNKTSCCSPSWPSFGVVSVLDFSHSNRSVAVFHCCLIFNSLMTWCWTFFIFLYETVYLLWWSLFRYFAHFLTVLLVSLLLNFKNSLWFWIIRYVLGKYFLWQFILFMNYIFPYLFYLWPWLLFFLIYTLKRGLFFLT